MIEAASVCRPISVEWLERLESRAVGLVFSKFGTWERSVMMARKVICDLHLMSADFGREDEHQPGNAFRITFRHMNGAPTGVIEVHQSDARIFAAELEALAAFVRAALFAEQKQD